MSLPATVPVAPARDSSSPSGGVDDKKRQTSPSARHSSSPPPSKTLPVTQVTVRPSIRRKPVRKAPVQTTPSHGDSNTTTTTSFASSEASSSSPFRVLSPLTGSYQPPDTGLDHHSPHPFQQQQHIQELQTKRSSLSGSPYLNSASSPSLVPLPYIHAPSSPAVFSDTASLASTSSLSTTKRYHVTSMILDDSGADSTHGQGHLQAPSPKPESESNSSHDTAHGNSISSPLIIDLKSAKSVGSSASKSSYRSKGSISTISSVSTVGTTISSVLGSNGGSASLKRKSVLVVSPPPQDATEQETPSPQTIHVLASEQGDKEDTHSTTESGSKGVAKPAENLDLAADATKVTTDQDLRAGDFTGTTTAPAWKDNSAAAATLAVATSSSTLRSSSETPSVDPPKTPAQQPLFPSLSASPAPSSSPDILLDSTPPNSSTDKDSSTNVTRAVPCLTDDDSSSPNNDNNLSTMNSISTPRVSSHQRTSSSSSSSSQKHLHLHQPQQEKQQQQQPLYAPPPPPPLPPSSSPPAPPPYSQQYLHHHHPQSQHKKSVSNSSFDFGLEPVRSSSLSSTLNLANNALRPVTAPAATATAHNFDPTVPTAARPLQASSNPFIFQQHQQQQPVFQTATQSLSSPPPSLSSSSSSMPPPLQLQQTQPLQPRPVYPPQFQNYSTPATAPNWQEYTPDPAPNSTITAASFTGPTGASISSNNSTTVTLPATPTVMPAGYHQQHVKQQTTQPTTVTTSSTNTATAESYDNSTPANPFLDPPPPANGTSSSTQQQPMYNSNTQASQQHQPYLINRSNSDSYSLTPSTSNISQYNGANGVSISSSANIGGANFHHPPQPQHSQVHQQNIIYHSRSSSIHSNRSIRSGGTPKLMTFPANVTQYQQQQQPASSSSSTQPPQQQPSPQLQQGLARNISTSSTPSFSHQQRFSSSSVISSYSSTAALSAAANAGIQAQQTSVASPGPLAPSNASTNLNNHYALTTTASITTNTSSHNRLNSTSSRISRASSADSMMPSHSKNSGSFYVRELKRRAATLWCDIPPSVWGLPIGIADLAPVRYSTGAGYAYGAGMTGNAYGGAGGPGGNGLGNGGMYGGGSSDGPNGNSNNGDGSGNNGVSGNGSGGGEWTGPGSGAGDGTGDGTTDGSSLTATDMKKTFAYHYAAPATYKSHLTTGKTIVDIRHSHLTPRLLASEIDGSEDLFHSRNGGNSVSGPSSNNNNSTNNTNGADDGFASLLESHKKQGSTGSMNTSNSSGTRQPATDWAYAKGSASVRSNSTYTYNSTNGNSSGSSSATPLNTHTSNSNSTDNGGLPVGRLPNSHSTDSLTSVQEDVGKIKLFVMNPDLSDDEDEDDDTSSDSD